MAVGTKLQIILAKMAIEITERHVVVQGIPLVEGSDKYFWFGRPQLVLHLIHFALFQVLFNALINISCFCFVFLFLDGNSQIFSYFAICRMHSK